MYSLKILTDFAAAHALRNYTGNCANLHGHTWKVEVIINSKQLDKNGIAIDFRIIKNYTQDIISKIDHKYLNEIKPFDKINPTAENIAKYLYDKLSSLITTNNTHVGSVSVWETPRACATYYQ